MTVQNNQSLNWIKLFGIISLIIGIMLLIFMISFEDEPGALPLLLITVGAAALVVNWLRNKRK